MGLFYIYTLLHGTFNVHLEVNILLGLDNSILNIPYWDFKYEHNLQGLRKVDINITYWDFRRFRKNIPWWELCTHCFVGPRKSLEEVFLYFKK